MILAYATMYQPDLEWPNSTGILVMMEEQGEINFMFCSLFFWNFKLLFIVDYYADVKFGWSWGLSILAGFVEILAIILTILTRSSDDE